MKLNNININRIYYGEVCIENIYIGDQLVYTQSCVVEPSVFPSALPPEFSAFPSTLPPEPSIVSSIEPSIATSTPPTEPSTVPSTPPTEPSIVPSTPPPEPPQNYYWCIVPALSGVENNCEPDFANSYCIYTDSATVAAISKCLVYGPHEDFDTCVDNCQSPIVSPSPCPSVSPSPSGSPLISASPRPTPSFIPESQNVQSVEPSTPIYLGGDVQGSQSPGPSSYY